MNTRPIIILVVAQIFLLVTVFILVGIFMKMWGYPDARPWPALPPLFREQFIWLFLGSVVWASLAIFTAARAHSFYKSLIIIGIALAALLAFFGIDAVFQSMAGPKMPLVMSTN